MLRYFLKDSFNKYAKRFFVREFFWNEPFGE